MDTARRKTSYYYDPDIGNHYYGYGHPMKPHRVRLAHTLIMRYGLYRHMEMLRPVRASEQSMAAFHTPDYIEFLKNVTPESQEEFAQQLRQYSVASDCPVFDNMFEYCQMYTGGSVGGAVRLNHGMADTVVNWAGGLHHAKKSEASGFCYVNDIVLAILELLKYHHRVVYIDIDVHHGDGVEEAFLTSDRVMTVSFHKHGDAFFPGTGDICDVGVGPGKYYAVNVPLKDGMDDESFKSLFDPIMTKVMQVYQPGAVVLQSGADSLTQDKLGVFNLSIKGHGACHKLMSTFGVPLLVLGGGGYKVKNVARCWTYETGVLLGKEEGMCDEMPPNEYYEYFGPDYRLQIPPSTTMENRNRRETLERLRNTVLENLQNVRPVSTSFHTRAPDALTSDGLKSERAGGRTCKCGEDERMEEEDGL